MTTQTIYDDQYTGERFIYGLRNRPPGIGCVPTGRIVGADEPSHPDFGHGTVEYARRLTDDDIRSYELTPLTSRGETVYRVCCARLDGDADNSVAGWTARFEGIGGRVLGDEDTEDTGLDCALLVAVLGRDTFWKKMNRACGTALWTHPYLLLGAERAEAWHQQDNK